MVERNPDAELSQRLNCFPFGIPFAHYIGVTNFELDAAWIEGRIRE